MLLTGSLTRSFICGFHGASCWRQELGSNLRPGSGRAARSGCRWGRPGSSAWAAASNGGCREAEERRACEGPRGWWALYAQLECYLSSLNVPADLVL